MIEKVLAPIIRLKGLFPYDFLVLGVVLAILFVYAVYFGRDRIVSLILAYYPATFLYKIFPFINSLIVLHGDKLIAVNKLIIFLIYLSPLAIIIYRYVFSESGLGGTKIIRSLGLSIAALILIIIFSHTILNLDTLYNFSDNLDWFFSSPIKLFVWNLVPIALLAIF